MSIDIQLMNKRQDGQWSIVCLPKEEVYNLGLATVKNKSGEYLEDPKTKDFLKPFESWFNEHQKTVLVD